MKKCTLFLAFGILPFALWSYEFTPEQFRALYALEGQWKSERNSGVLFEVWQKQNDSTLYGYSYRVRNSDTAYLEKIQLMYRSGAIIYQPTTMNQNNQQPVNFSLSRLSDSLYEFENRQHDFPQLIGYDMSKADSLHAYISGPTPNGPRSIHYHYIKLK